jgi:hypothetical protein
MGRRRGGLDGRQSVGDHFLHEVALLNVSEGSRVLFLGLIRRFAGERVYFSKATLVYPNRVRMAQKLLDDGLSVAEVRYVLEDLCGVKMKTAYRLISRALHQRFMERQFSMFGECECGEGVHHG